MIVVLDRQHVGKPGKDDRGAQTEINGETVYEIDLTAGYIDAAVALLSAEGHTVHVLESGWYSQRHERTAEIARDNPHDLVAYVACHVNAGGGSYGLALHDARSRSGLSLAEAIADTLGTVAAPHLDRAIVRSTEPGGTWARAHSTIAGIWDAPANCAGVCFEPMFIDSPRHRELLTPAGLQVIGQALAAGCMTWAGA